MRFQKLPPDQWSLKYPKCIKCGINRKDKRKHRHAGKGLCKRCTEIIRRSQPRVKAMIKANSERHYKKVGKTEKYRKYHRERARVELSKKDSTYSIAVRKRVLKRTFLRFLSGKRASKKPKYQNGVIITCPICDKKVRSPIQYKDLRDDKMHHLRIFEKLIIELCQTVGHKTIK